MNIVRKSKLLKDKVKMPPTARQLARDSLTFGGGLPSLQSIYANFPLPLTLDNTFNLSNNLTFAASDIYSYIFQPSKTGSIQNIQFFTNNAISVTSPYIIGFQTINLTTNPITASGSYISSTASISYIPSSGWNVVTFPTPVSVTQGEFIAITITAPSSGQGTVSLNSINEYTFMPLLGHYVALSSGWTYPGATTSFVVQYTDNTYCDIPLNFPYTTSNYLSYPNIGILFSLPFSCSLNGFYSTQNGWKGSATINVYDNNSNLLTSMPVYQTIRGNFTVFTLPVSIKIIPNINYRITFSTLGAEPNIRVLNFVNNSIMNSFTGLSNFMLTTSNSLSPTLSSWTDTNTSIPFNMGINISGVSPGNMLIFDGPMINFLQ